MLVFTSSHGEYRRQEIISEWCSPDRFFDFDCRLKFVLLLCEFGDISRMKAFCFCIERLMSLRVLGVSMLLFVLVGCNSKVMVPVKGSVTSDGKPLAGANVMMFLDGNDRGQTAAAVTGEDGVFSISTGVDMGMAPGTYTVTITWPDPAIKPTPEQMMTGNRPDAPDLLYGKYASRASSTIKAEVTTSTQVLEPFDVVVPERKPEVTAAPVDDDTVTIKAPEVPLNFEPPSK